MYIDCVIFLPTEVLIHVHITDFPNDVTVAFRPYNEASLQVRYENVFVTYFQVSVVRAYYEPTLYPVNCCLY